MANFIKQLSQKRILVPHINRYLELGKFPESWKLEITPNRGPDSFFPSFHPSGDCTPCVKQLYAKLKGFLPDDKLAASSQKNFAVGNFWHIWLQTIIVEGLGFCGWDEVEKGLNITWPRPKVEGEFDLEKGFKPPRLPHEQRLWWGTGTADIAHCDIPGVGKFLIDFKTMNSRYFAKDESELTFLTDKWKAQVSCYMDWLGDIDRAIVVGIQKDSPHEFREFLFDKDDTLVYNIYNKWTEVAQSVKENVAPATCEHGEVCPADEFYRLRS